MSCKLLNETKKVWKNKNPIIEVGNETKILYTTFTAGEIDRQYNSTTNYFDD